MCRCRKRFIPLCPFVLYKINNYNILAAVDPSCNIGYEDTSLGWNKFLDDVKRSLDPLDLEIRHTMDEIKGVRVYALVGFELSICYYSKRVPVLAD